MPDWTALHQARVQPVLQSHAAPIPAVVWAVADAAALVGVALLILLSYPRNLLGLIPLLLVGFGAWAVAGNRQAVRTGEVVVRRGTVTALRVEQRLSTNTTNGATEARPVHVVEVDTTARGVLTEAGATLQDHAAHERLTTSAAIHAPLSPGDELLGISLPTAPQHVHWRVVGAGLVE